MTIEQDSATAQGTVGTKRKAWLAGLLSLFVPGLGQIYSGQLQRGIIFYALAVGAHVGACAVLIELNAPPYNAIVGFILIVTVRGAAVVDAILTAKKQADSYQLRACNRWYVYLAAAALTFFIISPTVKALYVQAYRFPAGSMADTLLIGDHVLARKFVLGIPMHIVRGDVIVFQYPEDESKDFLKRVVGLPGDTIEIKDKIVYINGALVDDKAYTKRVDPDTIKREINPRDNFGPVVVPGKSYFVLGDNRDQSLDSRFFGYVEASKIKGKVSVIYWSWDGKDSRVRWERIGRSIQ